MAITRREALQAGAGLVAGACLQEAVAQQPAKAAGKGHIDAHVHVWTPDLEKYPLAKGFSREQMQPPSFTPEELLALAKPCGVERIVLIQMSFYRYDNSYMLDTMKRFPGVFSGVAVIDENGKDPAAEMRAMKAKGVRGFRIRPEDRSRETWLDGDGMAAMWRCGASEGLAMCHLVDPDSLPAIDRMCTKYPETPAVIDHYARIGVDGQIRENDVASLCRLAKHKNMSVKVSAYYALGKKEMPYLDLGPMTRRLLDAYGRERLMWATDCPFQVQNGHTYTSSIELIRDRLDFLTDEDRQWLLRKTAERVFFA